MVLSDWKGLDLHKDNCNVLNELIASSQLRQKTPPSEISPCRLIPKLQYHFNSQQHMSGLITSVCEANYNFNQQNDPLSGLRIQRFLQSKLLVNPVESVSPANKYPACHLAERVICLRCGPWSLHVPQRDEDRGIPGRVMVCPVILTKPCGGGLKGAGVSDAAVCQLCLSRANYHPVFRPDMVYGNRPTTVSTLQSHSDPHTMLI